MKTEYIHAYFKMSHECFLTQKVVANHHLRDFPMKRVKHCATNSKCNSFNSNKNVSFGMTATIEISNAIWLLAIANYVHSFITELHIYLYL